MHREKPNLLVVSKPDYSSPDERTTRQVERPPSLFDDQPLNFVLALDRGQRCQIHDRQLNPESRRDYLSWLSIDHRKCRSQSFVTPHDVVETPLECPQVERSFQSNRYREIVDRVSRIKLIDKPQPLLRKGEW